MWIEWKWFSLKFCVNDQFSILFFRNWDWVNCKERQQRKKGKRTMRERCASDGVDQFFILNFATLAFRQHKHQFHTHTLALSFNNRFSYGNFSCVFFSRPFRKHLIRINLHYRTNDFSVYTQFLVILIWMHHSTIVLSHLSNLKQMPFFVQNFSLDIILSIVNHRL